MSERWTPDSWRSRPVQQVPAYPDPKFPEGKLLVVDIEARGKLGRPVTLAEIKALGEFEDSPLVRMGRLSVVPLTAAQWKAIEALCKA